MNSSATPAAATRPLTSPTQQPPPRPAASAPPQSLFTAQPISTTTTTTIRLPNPNPPPQGILYPVASSGRGFITRPLRPQTPDQTVTVANPGGPYPPRSVVAFPHQVVRPFGFSTSDSMNHPVHVMRAPTYVQHPNLGVTTAAGLVPIKGIPVSAHPKVASSPTTISDCNGYKDSRSKDDGTVMVRDRKVRILDGASLYALCRSWLRNGFHEERQPQYGDGTKTLPRPLPIPVVDNNLQKKKEVEEYEEEEGSAENLSMQELLQRHVKRAKRVRGRLREERLQRIARYKARLATLLPPPIEQFTDDPAAGN